MNNYIKVDPNLKNEFLIRFEKGEPQSKIKDILSDYEELKYEKIESLSLVQCLLFYLILTISQTYFLYKIRYNESLYSVFTSSLFFATLNIILLATTVLLWLILLYVLYLFVLSFLSKRQIDVEYFYFEFSLVIAIIRYTAPIISPNDVSAIKILRSWNDVEYNLKLCINNELNSYTISFADIISFLYYLRDVDVKLSSDILKLLSIRNEIIYHNKVYTYLLENEYLLLSKDVINRLGPLMNYTEFETKKV